MVKPSVRSNKAQTQYEGPYKVARHTSGGTYTLRDLDGQLLSRNYAPEQIKPLTSSNINDEKTYEVETILADRAIANGAPRNILSNGKDTLLKKIRGYHRHHPQISFQEEEIFLEKLSS